MCVCVCLFLGLLRKKGPNAPLVSNLVGKEIEEGQREREGVGFNGTQSALFFSFFFSNVVTFLLRAVKEKTHWMTIAVVKFGNGRERWWKK